MNSEQQDEWLTCAESAGYFIHHYCQVYDASPAVAAWMPFHLWPAQKKVLRTLQSERLVVILKARQIGMTWLTLGRALWLMEFHPKATVGLFSRRDDEAIDLIDFRLKGMHERLPDWMKSQIESSNDHEYVLSNGSRAKAFPPNAGDSYTFTLAIADEFDLVPDQGHLMRSVKPAIDAGGSMILLSRADKNKPESEFKRIYAAAKEGKSTFKPIFLSWQARPDRTPEWYEEQRRECESRGALDDLYEQYPTTDNEALSMRGAGLVYPAWSEENVTEKAEYMPGNGPIYWAVDDGTVGKKDASGHYTGDSHPRAFGIYQKCNNGEIHLFYEHYAVSMFAEQQIDIVVAESKKNGWPMPQVTIVDKSASDLKLRLHGKGFQTRNSPASVEESVKNAAAWIAPDTKTGQRLFSVHPRCTETIYEYNNYRRNSDTGEIIKAFDHGVDRDRYLLHAFRFEK